jgi:hypothetical protein
MQIGTGAVGLQEADVVGPEELADVPQADFEGGGLPLPHEVARDRGEQRFESEPLA